MARMSREQHIDPDLFELFLTSGVYRAYADIFLLPEQIDEIDVGRYPGTPGPSSWRHERVAGSGAPDQPSLTTRARQRPVPTASSRSER